MFDSMWAFPFMAAGFGLAFILWIIATAFWIWMIIDCAKRNFRNMVEKIIWLVLIVIGGFQGGWFMALIYFIVIRNINPSGLFKK